MKAVVAKLRPLYSGVQLESLLLVFRKHRRAGRLR